MTHPRTLSGELIARTLGFLIMMDPQTLMSCSLVDSKFRSISRRLTPLFHYLYLSSEEDVDTLHSLVIGNSNTPLTSYCREISLTLSVNAKEDTTRKAMYLLFKCSNAKIVDISNTIIDLANVSILLPRVHTVVLDNVTFCESGLTHFLGRFTTVSTLSITSVSQQRALDLFSPSLPSTLRCLNIVFDATDDTAPLQHGFLHWMIQHPHKVPQITQLCCMGIGMQNIDDIVLLLSLLKPTMTQLTLGMGMGGFVGESDLLSFVFTNDLPLVAYEGSQGSDLDDVIVNYDSDSFDIE